MPETNPVSGTRDAVAHAVREAMREKNISGRALAERLGMKQSVFSRRMCGDVAFDVDELAEIAAQLDVSLDTLVAGVTSERAS